MCRQGIDDQVCFEMALHGRDRLSDQSTPNMGWLPRHRWHPTWFRSSIQMARRCLCYFSCIEEARLLSESSQGQRVDSAWRSLPVEEAGSLIAMLNKDE